MTVDKEGRRQEMDLRWTPVWANRGGSWLLVHEHLSAAASPAP